MCNITMHKARPLIEFSTDLDNDNSYNIDNSMDDLRKSQNANRKIFMSMSENMNVKTRYE